MESRRGGIDTHDHRAQPLAVVENIRDQSTGIEHDSYVGSDSSGIRMNRRLTRRGIHVNGLTYSAPVLYDITRAIGKRLDLVVCVAPGNLGNLDVLDPTDFRRKTIPCTYKRYANGLALAQHRKILALARRENACLCEEKLLWYRSHIGALLEDAPAMPPNCRNCRSHILDSDPDCNQLYYFELMAALAKEIRQLDPHCPRSNSK